MLGWEFVIRDILRVCAEEHYMYKVINLCHVLKLSVVTQLVSASPLSKYYNVPDCTCTSCYLELRTVRTTL